MILHYLIRNCLKLLFLGLIDNIGKVAADHGLIRGDSNHI